MKFLAIASTLLLAGSAVAAPGTALRRRNAEDKLVSRRASRVMMPSESDAGNITTNKNVQYSNNWGGAVLVGDGYTSVTGTFNAPSPPSDGSGSAWVGIDGDTCQSAILQTGIDWTYNGGEVSFDAWYEWFPDYEYNFDGISISPGDQISVTVTATGANSGTATVTNDSNGDSVSHTFEAQNGDLCYENAEWIVEDFESDGALVPFADYGSITFTGATATQNGATVDTAGAEVLDMQGSDGSVLSACSASGSSVSCTYQ